MGNVSYKFRMFIVLLAVLVLAVFSGAQLALAGDGDESADLSATEIAVTLSQPTATNGAGATLDRVVYHANDEIIVSWKGATVDDDFIIPTAIKTSEGKTISMSELNKVDTVQTANTEYERRMSEAGTMTTYDALKNYVTSEHSVSLGVATISTTVEVQYERVSPVYRMYNMITSEHLFTTQKYEYDRFYELGLNDQEYWIGEGIDWLAPATETNTKVVHRLYNAALGAMGHTSHYYTADEAEIADLCRNWGWTDDGADNQFRSGGTTAIYTCYNEALGSAHHYTSSKSEWQGLEAHGWALEEDKNGTDPVKDPEGVFQCTMATNWSFSPNYYTVEHKLENLDGTYSLAESQVVAGTANTDTNAVARSYPGFTPQDVIVQSNILQNNSTKIEINYSRNSYDANFETSNNEVTVAKQSGKHGTSVVHPGEVNAGQQNVLGWYWDAGLKHEFNFEATKMPIGGVMLYASWREYSSSYTVTFHANNDKATGEMATMTREIGDNLQLTGNGFSLVVDGIVYGMEYWTTAEDGSGMQYRDKFLGDLDLTNGKEIHLYAKWTERQLGDYWIAASKNIKTDSTSGQDENIYYTNPETSVIKTQEQIAADVASMEAEVKNGTTVSEGSVSNEYKALMNSDEYHLYTYYGDQESDWFNGGYVAGGVQQDNKYAEFRVIQVGAHEATGDKTDGSKYSDGTVVTFQMTHTLPKWVDSVEGRVNNGWYNSVLRESLNEGEVFNNFRSGFTNDIATVQKWGKTYEQEENIASSLDKFWTLSASEVYGDTTPNAGIAPVTGAWALEGDQYDYHIKVGGYVPRGTRSGGSLDYHSSYSFRGGYTLYTNADPVYGQSYAYGREPVIIAFAFGSTNEEPVVQDNRTAFAVYSSDDGSLNFYKRDTVPAVGETFEGKTVTDVYMDVESANAGGKKWLTADLTRYKSVRAVDKIRPVTMSGWFSWCRNLESADLYEVDTSACIDMSLLFYACFALKTVDISSFDTSNVTAMDSMFSACTSLQTVDVSHFNTSKVTRMNSMFWACGLWTGIDVSNFDTSNVTNMQYMFGGCGRVSNLDVSNFDTSSVTNMQYMFSSCSSLTGLDISNFDTSKVTTMCAMFSGCSSLASLDVGSFQTSNVTDMSRMFENCSSLKGLDVSNFDTAMVTNMSQMFSHLSLSSLDLSNFNTDLVTDMNSMFSNCTSLVSLNISKFNTSSVTDMFNMFYNCSALETIGSIDFNTGNVTDMRSMFYGCKVLQLDCTAWDVSKVETNVSVSYGSGILNYSSYFNYNAPGVTPPVWKTA